MPSQKGELCCFLRLLYLTIRKLKYKWQNYVLSHLIATQHKQSGTCLKIGAREAWNFIPCRSNRKATTQEKQEEQPPNCKYVCAVGKYVAFRVQLFCYKVAGIWPLNLGGLRESY